MDGQASIPALLLQIVFIGACNNLGAEVTHKLTNQRLFALDAARGIAMLLVCTAHFIDIYYPDGIQSENLLVNSLYLLCRIATPTFVIVSGILVGYFSKINPQGFAQLRLHLFDRALFLATAGHILMAASLATRSGFAKALSSGYVTDMLAFCVIGGLFVFRYTLTSSTRLRLGIMLYLIGWAGWSFWHPDNPMLITLRAIMLGPDENGPLIVGFPLLPWFGVYLIATFIGNWLGKFERSNLPLAAKALAKLSGIVLGTAVFTKVFLFVLRNYGVIDMTSSSVYLPLVSYQKYPPGPFYILIFASAALLLLSGLLSLSRAKETNMYLNIAEQIGRNSFSIYVIQFFIYYTAFYFLMTQIYVPTFPIAILFHFSSLFCIALLSMAFSRFKLNRALTIGLPAMVRRWPVLNDLGEQPTSIMPSKLGSIGPIFSDRSKSNAEGQS